MKKRGEERRRAGKVAFAVALATAAMAVGLSLRAGIERDIARLSARFGSDVLVGHSDIGRPLSDAALDSYRATDGARAVAAVGLSSEFHVQGEDYELTWLRTTPNILQVLQLELAQGTGWQDGSHGVILGSQVAEAVFGDDDPIGQEIEGFPVIGVLAPVAPDNPLREFYNRRILLLQDPHESFVPNMDPGTGASLRNEAKWRSVYVLADEPLPQVMEALSAVNDSVTWHEAVGYYELGFYADRLLHNVLIIAALGLFLMAAVLMVTLISLSGIERTQEIGIRRALGATRGEVVRLFLGEAVVTGSFGCLAGFAAAVVLNALMGDAACWSWLHLLILPGVIALCLLASIGPAAASARRPPHEAMQRRSLFGAGAAQRIGLRVMVGGSIAVAVASLVLTSALIVSSRTYVDTMWGAIDDRLLLVEAPDETILAGPDLRAADEELLSAVPGVDEVVPFMLRTLAARKTAVAVGEIYAELSLFHLVAGRDLSPDDFHGGEAVCLLAVSYVERNGLGDGVGTEIVVRGQAFLVVGVFEDRVSVRQVIAADIVIPWSYRTLFGFGTVRFFAHAADDADLAGVREEIRTLFRDLYPDRATVSVSQVNADSVKWAQLFTQAAVRLGLLGIVALTLAVGEAVALARFMLALQQRDLGISRALGARSRQAYRAALTACGREM
ncbi:ABC transporter permease, partial [Candidatus Bipolaricaulota bacterium]|nr:ABC transporter permease [Candidatus Bipolaricaulota bacterium]